MRRGVAVLCGALATLAAGCRSHPKPWSVPAADAATVRKVAEGQVIGGLGRYDSHAWLGIPFAAPPIGDLRWRAPKPSAPWTGRREALTFASACPQFASAIGGVDEEPGTVVGNEDCLYLNVWAPRFAPDAVPSKQAALPVLFWIHGGGNSIGTSAFFDGGRLAAEQHAIVVTIQYRLGPLGWLSSRGLREGQTDSAERSGNFGTLDVLQALRWTRANIAAFGGNPDNLTVFGESAGGLNTYALLVSPLAKGLFQRAMVESGGLSETTPEEAEHFADDAQPGNKNSSSELLTRLLLQEGAARDHTDAKQKVLALSDAQIGAVLRRQTPAQLLQAYSASAPIGMIDMPTVFDDGVVLPPAPWTDRFEHPDQWNQVPVILGTNHDEMKLFLILDPKRVSKRFGVIPHVRNEPDYLATAEWTSRAWKAHNADAPAVAMRRGGATDVYVYRFDWHDEPTIWGADLAKLLGAAHGFEIPFVFGHFDLGRLGKQLFDKERLARAEGLSSAMRGYLGEFARTGKPGTGSRSDLIAWTAWDDSRPDTPRFIDLDLPSGGGIRMSSAAENLPALLVDIAQDPRLPTPIQKCRTFQLLTGFIHGLSAADYATKVGCQDFPLDRYPWDRD